MCGPLRFVFLHNFLSQFEVISVFINSTVLVWEHSSVALLAVINTILACGSHPKVSA